jgi:hypothetical protein
MIVLISTSSEGLFISVLCFQISGKNYQELFITGKLWKYFSRGRKTEGKKNVA